MRVFVRCSIRDFGVLLIALAVSAPAAVTQDAVYHFEFSGGLQESGWKIHTPRGKTAAEFEVVQDGALTISAEGGVSFLYRDVPKQFGGYSQLSWDWRVDRDFPPTDLSTPGVDDRPLALHVYFDDAGAGLMGRIGGMFGLPTGGYVMTYVWGGGGLPGTVVPNPFMKDGKGALIILMPSDPSQLPSWHDVQVDLAADYQRVFGIAPPRLRGLAISSDTDDTGATAQASIRKLNLSSAAPR